MKLVASVCVADTTSTQVVRCSAKCATLIIKTQGDATALSIIFRDSSKLFKLTNNVIKIFDRHIQQGCMTIRLKAPEKDILLRNADPKQLRDLLEVLRTIESGMVPTGKLSKTFDSPILARLQDMQQSKLTIKHREDYPMGKSFPPNLQQMSARDLKLRCLDSRLLNLSKLSHLNLGSNQIRQLPQAIEAMSLVTLIVDNNLLTAWPNLSDGSPITKTLSFLDLSHNQIEWLPDNFWVLNNLMTVKLSHLGLRGVPAAYLNKVTRLNCLDLTQNRLSCLPFSLLRIRPASLSVCSNAFIPENRTMTHDIEHFVPSLLDISSRVCAQLHSSKLLDASIPWSLAIRMAVHRPCLCCYKQCGLAAVRVFLHNEGFSRSISLCSNPDNQPVFICYLCGPTCVKLYNLKPWKYEPS